MSSIFTVVYALLVQGKTIIRKKGMDVNGEKSTREREGYGMSNVLQPSYILIALAPVLFFFIAHVEWQINDTDEVLSVSMRQAF